MDNQPVNKSHNQKLNLSLDLRFLTIALLVVIAGMLVVWKPWTSTSKNSDRSVEVTGTAKLTARPDEYTFNPIYEFSDASKETALAAMSKQSDEIVTKLKALGVPDSKIKTNSNGSDYPVYYNETSQDTTYTLGLTVTVSSHELAQKVQEYLIATTPTGAVSPQANFSDAKRKQLESQARDQATKEARAKAEQSAKNLGFKLDHIKSVTDGSGFGIQPYPTIEGVATDGIKSAALPQLNIQPGENDLIYSVTVTYYLR